MLRKIKNKLKSGSVLVYTLIILFVLLSMALSIASVTVIEKKSALTTGKSNQAFQVADSGAEIIMQAVRKGSYDTISEMADAYDGADCYRGVMTADISGGKIRVTFFDKEDGGDPIDNCENSFSSVRRIKSVGSYEGSVRAVEVAVAAQGDSGI